MPCIISNIKRRMCLDPEFLDSNIRTHLLNEIKKNTENECNKEHGYILQVNRIVEIEKNNISSASSDIVFTVIFEALTLKPTQGDKFESKIVVILSNNQGILVNVRDKFMVIIPATNIGEFVFDVYEGVKTIRNPEQTRSYMENDILKIEIRDVKYEDKVFKCVGSMIEDI